MFSASALAADCAILFSPSILCHAGVAGYLQDNHCPLERANFLADVLATQGDQLSSGDLNILLQTVRDLQVPDKDRRTPRFPQVVIELESKKMQMLAKIASHHRFRSVKPKELDVKEAVERMLIVQGPRGIEAAEVMADYVTEHGLFSATEAGFILEAIKNLKDPAQQFPPKPHFSNLFKRAVSRIKADLDWYL